jgi:CP family cyanate transporter-like MFS transporter
MGLYTVGLTGGAALASAGAALLVHAGWGWRATLASAAAPAALALAAWVVRSWRRGGRTPDTEASWPEVPHVAVWRYRLAWQLSAYMGCQSLLFYSLMAWMPLLLLEHGVGRGVAGTMLALYNLLGIVVAMTVSLFFGGRWGSRWLAVVAAYSWLVGVCGFLLAPEAFSLWVVSLGVTHGLGIAATFALVAEKSRSSGRARDLSGMVQLVGYLLAAFGPTGLGWLRDTSGGWGSSLTALAALAAVAVVMIVLGHGASRSVARV